MSTMTMTMTPPTTLALTRRGRLVVFAASLLLVLAFFVLWGSGSVATEQPGTAEPTLVVQVQPGDTLYDLAASITVDGDVNAMVERIEDLNRLESAMLYAGQKLRVPVA